jgi:hypothetical protein
VRIAKSNAWAISTRSCHRSGLRQFHKFCDREGVAAHLRLPASELLLCAFAASTLGIRSASTARCNLEAVRAWHIEEGFSYAGNNSVELTYVLRGIENVRPASSFKAPQASLIPTAGNLREPVGSRVLHLPFTKTDPTAAMLAHLEGNIVRPDAPLFSYRPSRGPVCLTKRKFLARCNSIWVACGLTAVGGHSFRVGGATELLVCGAHPAIVRKMGRWNSDEILVIIGKVKCRRKCSSFSDKLRVNYDSSVLYLVQIVTYVYKM